MLGVTYPLFMLYTIVATGNHFVLDAIAGAVVVIAAWFIARAVLDKPAQPQRSAMLSA